VARPKGARVQLFLSHSTRDRGIAEALKELLEEVFGDDRVRVEFSSDQQAGGGIPPGVQWLPWITERISKADKTYVLLTPNSMSKPWVLWESGAAAGVALATNKASPVVPITFGIRDADIPSPLSAAQRVRGDSTEADGINRLLQDVNLALKKLLTKKAFASTMDDCLPGFLAKVKTALAQSSPAESLLASIPHSFSASSLGGYWVTCYQFGSSQALECHADIARVTAESDRRLRARNYPPEPRTEGHASPFRNEIEAELANRHLIGHWKNLSDTRYFGSIHLAVLPGETVMEGYYTSYSNDVHASSGRWRWVRLDPASLGGVELSRVVLREPGMLHELVENHSKKAAPLALTAVAEGI
jgi:hypothetical protein